MSLIALPVEVFSIFTAYLHHLDIYNLFYIGSSVLNAKLAKGVTELRIVFDGNYDPRPWPPYPLRFTSLQFLLIQNEQFYASRQTPFEILQNSTCTVREMHLSGAGVYKAFQKHMLARPHEAYPVLETLIISGTSIRKPNVPAPKWPKSLARLSFDPMAVGCYLEPSSLPPNLTALSGNYNSLVKHYANQALPTCITYLKLAFDQLESDLFQLLPIGLKTLSLSVSCRYSGDSVLEAEWTKSAIPRLPPGLTDLEWPVATPHQRDMLLALPTTLTSLKHAMVEPTEFDALPRSLTYCDALDSKSGECLREETICSLPPRLKRLSMNMEMLAIFRPEVNVSVIVGSSPLFDEKRGLPRTCKSFSPRITALTLPSMRNVPAEKLPQNLQFLTLSSGSLTIPQVSLLPRSLQELILQNGGIPSEEEAWASLPRRLTCLVLCAANALSSESSALLPSTLRSLKLLGNVNAPFSWFEGLPDGLQALQLNWALKLTTSPKMHFPPSLLRLTLCMSVDPVTAKNTSSVMTNIFCALPPTLEHLWLSYGSCPGLCLLYSISDLYRLPKRLRHLILPYLKDIIPSRFRGILPKSLLRAAFSFSNYPAHC